MTRCRFILLLGAAMLLHPSLAAARCLGYEPAIVHLTGELTSKTLPGPPGYTSIARGDTPEVVYILKLAKPVCVSGDPGSRHNARSHAALGEIQLVGSQTIRPWSGKQVRVSGKLTGPSSGHHRTPVVLQVSSLGAS